MNVIVVDDDQDFSLLVKNMLERRGHSVEIDPAARKLADLRHNQAQLVLLDVNLQSRDGGDLCTQLKSDSRTSSIPVILMSGIMDLRPISQMCGADDYLIKPFEISTLEALIDKWEQALQPA